MSRSSPFGSYLRRLRESRRIRSAAQLGRRAGLSASHIAMFERGEVLPRWNTAVNLADALQLQGDDRDEFLRRLDAAGKPPAARDATRGLAIAGVAVWRHLPELLDTIDGHQLAAWQYDANDDKFRDSVPGIASLLAWVAVTRSPPTDAERIHLIERAQQAFDSANELGQSLPRGHRWTRAEIALHATTTLPLTWRTEKFRDRRKAASLSKLLSSWVYYPAYRRPASLSVWFNDRDLQQRFGFEFIEPSLVVAVHDMLTTQKLWDDLKLGERFRIPDGTVVLPGVIVDADDQQELGDAKLRLLFDDDLSLIVEADIAATRKAVQQSARHYERVLYATGRLAFAERVYEIPALASWLIGRPLDVLRARRQAVEQLLDEVGQAGAAALLKPPPKRARKARKHK